MRDHWLFAIAPYAAMSVALAAMTLRVALHADDPAARNAGSRTRRGRAPIVWIAAIGLVGLAHAAGLAFPAAVLLWTREEVRLVALESEGLVAGTIALAGVLVILARTIRRRPASTPALIDVAALTLVAVSMVSGVLMALTYRWASSWAEVTLVPYLYSVARLEPATTLVTRLPALVKLHVASAFALLALAPCTTAGGRAARAIARVPQAVLSPARHSIGRWTMARLQTASAVMFGNGEEEN